MYATRAGTRSIPTNASRLSTKKQARRFVRNALNASTKSMNAESVTSVAKRLIGKDVPSGTAIDASLEKAGPGKSQTRQGFRWVRFIEVMMFHYAVFKSPADFPGRFVVRELIITKGKVMPGRLVANETTLEAAREKLPRGLFRVPKMAGDVPALVEVWI